MRGGVWLLLEAALPALPHFSRNSFSFCPTWTVLFFVSANSMDARQRWSWGGQGKAGPGLLVFTKCPTEAFVSLLPRSPGSAPSEQAAVAGEHSHPPARRPCSSQGLGQQPQSVGVLALSGRTCSRWQRHLAPAACCPTSWRERC